MEGSRGGLRVRFSTESPSRHTYSSSGSTYDDEDLSEVTPVAGPSRRTKRQSLPASFTTTTVSSRPVPPPPPPKSHPAQSHGPDTTRSSSGPSGTTRARKHGNAHEFSEQGSLDALTASLPKAPPRQTISKLEQIKSNNPFRKRYAKDPQTSSLLVTSPSNLSPPLGGQTQNSYFPPQTNSSPDPKTVWKSPPPVSTTNTASGAAMELAKAPPPPPPPRLPARKPSQLQSGPPPTLPPRNPGKTKTSVASSDSGSVDVSVQGQGGRGFPAASIIQRSLQAAEQARESRQGEASIEVLRRGEPPAAEILLATQTKPLRVLSDTSSPPLTSSFIPPSLRVKGQARTSSVSSHKHNEIISTVQEALREADVDDSPRPPPRKVSEKVKTGFNALAKPYVAAEPGINLWSCTDLLSNKGSTRTHYAMIILNQPVTRKDVFVRAWNASDLHICADGGANRLYDLWGPEQRNRYLPTMIKGDLDSLRSDVNTFYASKGVSIKHDSDQDSTDLMKCISEVEKIERLSDKSYSLLLMGGLSGRVDQTVHTMTILHKLRKTRPHTFVISSESLAWTLDQGSHLIDIDHATMGETCGILPVGCDSSFVTTKGLKWNLDWTTSFDGSVSTSNHLLPSEPVVYVRTSRAILWCIEIKPHLEPVHTTTTTIVHRDVRSPVEDISRGLSDIGMGVVKVAGEMGSNFVKDIDRLKNARDARKLIARQPINEEQGRLLEVEEVDEPDSAPQTDHEEGESWRMLD